MELLNWCRGQLMEWPFPGLEHDLRALESRFYEAIEFGRECGGDSDGVGCAAN